jgi:nucleoside-diphosphate-sugar epimerase
VGGNASQGAQTSLHTCCCRANELANIGSGGKSGRTMSRVLVTGASGFVGRAVITAFAAEGDAVRAAVRRPPQSPFPAGVEIVQHADFAEAVDWRSLVEGSDAVVHLAGIAHTGHGTSGNLYDRVNHQATEQLASAAAKAGVRRFVFVSSVRAQTGAVADHVLTERDAAVPADAYGRAKLAAEASVRAAGLPFTILRPVLIYGPGVKGNFNLLLRAAASPLPLPVKDFTNRRSLLGIDNFVSALRFVLASPAAKNETYLVADPRPAPTLPEIIVTLRQAQDRLPGIAPMAPRLIEWLLRIMRRGDLWQRIGGICRSKPPSSSPRVGSPCTIRARGSQRWFRKTWARRHACGTPFRPALRRRRRKAIRC